MSPGTASAVVAGYGLEGPGSGSQSNSSSAVPVDVAVQLGPWIVDCILSRSAVVLVRRAQDAALPSGEVNLALELLGPFETQVLKEPGERDCSVSCLRDFGHVPRSRRRRQPLAGPMVASSGVLMRCMQPIPHAPVVPAPVFASPVHVAFVAAAPLVYGVPDHSDLLCSGAVPHSHP